MHKHSLLLSLGQASEDGTSSNGDRVAEHAITATHFAHYQA